MLMEKLEIMVGSRFLILQSFTIAQMEFAEKYYKK